jgi:hypothetical protein
MYVYAFIGENAYTCMIISVCIMFVRIKSENIFSCARTMSGGCAVRQESPEALKLWNWILFDRIWTNKTSYQTKRVFVDSKNKIETSVLFVEKLDAWHKNPCWTHDQIKGILSHGQRLKLLQSANICPWRQFYARFNWLICSCMAWAICAFKLKCEQ